MKRFHLLLFNSNALQIDVTPVSHSAPTSGTCGVLLPQLLLSRALSSTERGAPVAAVPETIARGRMAGGIPGLAVLQ